jgi:hypothetical protein
LLLLLLLLLLMVFISNIRADGPDLRRNRCTDHCRRDMHGAIGPEAGRAPLPTCPNSFFRGRFTCARRCRLTTDDRRRWRGRRQGVRGNNVTRGEGKKPGGRLTRA